MMMKKYLNVIVGTMLAGYAFNIQAADCSGKDSSNWPSSRNVLEWPFASNSIWNMPIGCNARYVDSRISDVQALGEDINIFVTTKASDPKVPVMWAGGIWGNTNQYVYGPNTDRCRGNLEFESGFRINFPADFVLPSLGKNFATAILAPDGDSLRQLNALARCQRGEAVYGLNRQVTSCSESIRGDGNTCVGGQGGSGLSSIGGSIRKGDLTSNESIRHALKIELSGPYLYCGDLSQEQCQPRWPAKHSDVTKSFKNGTNVPAMRMGALLALRPQETYASLGIRSKPGRKLFDALQDYGGYISDGGNSYPGYHMVGIPIEKEASEEFKRVYGHEYKFNLTTKWRELNPDPGTSQYDWTRDVKKIFESLYVVDDNGPTSIGGGGAQRRRPLAPPVGGESKQTQIPSQMSASPPAAPVLLDVTN